MKQNWMVELPISRVGSVCEMYVVMERDGLVLPMNTPKCLGLAYTSFSPKLQVGGRILSKEC